jgi:hypothetical protein
VKLTTGPGCVPSTKRRKGLLTHGVFFDVSVGADFEGVVELVQPTLVVQMKAAMRSNAISFFTVRPSFRVCSSSFLDPCDHPGIFPVV